MSCWYSSTARRPGIVSAAVVLVLGIAYAITLVIGLASLASPDQAIGDPMFAILEVLIILMMPAVLGLMVAVHAWTPEGLKTLSTMAVVFTVLLAALTVTLHFTILTISRQPQFAQAPWPLVFSFTWPSIAYAVDIVAWDVFFALAMLFAAPGFTGPGLPSAVRVSMIASGALALAGLSGVITGNMQLRDIGIVGYVPAFMVVVGLLAVLFWRTQPQPD